MSMKNLHKLFPFSKLIVFTLYVQNFNVRNLSRNAYEINIFKFCCFCDFCPLKVLFLYMSSISEQLLLSLCAFWGLEQSPLP